MKKKHVNFTLNYWAAAGCTQEYHLAISIHQSGIIKYRLNMPGYRRDICGYLSYIAQKMHLISWDIFR